MAELKLEQLHKYYGAYHAVRGIDLHIPEGEFTVLVGPSGCGKSTLLRTIAGLEEVDGGRIQIGETVVNDMRPKDRDIAMVFQNYALYPYMKVYDNIAFGLRARKTPETEIERAVHRVAEMLDITAMLDRFPRDMSGGQRQRVAIGRAVVREARLYLFDEPLSNLDAKLREEMRAEIKRLHQEIGKTSIYVTHDQIEAMTMADRIVLLNDGSIVQQGSPLDLFERPVSKFVAGFLGSPSINFVDAVVENEGEGYYLAFEGDRRLALPSSRHESVAKYRGKQVTVGIRPEHIKNASVSRSAGGFENIKVTIDLVQPTGSRAHCSFLLNGIETVAELDSHDVSLAGQELEVSIDLNRVLLFDNTTDFVIK